jgi:hypothetical protein
MKRSCNFSTESMRLVCEIAFPTIDSLGEEAEYTQESDVMLDDYLYNQRPRNKRHFDWREIVGPVICGIAVTYLLAAGILGLLAR